MINVTFDCETYPIGEQGKATVNPFPRLVCAGFKIGSNDTVLKDRMDSIKLFDELLDRDDIRWIGHNMPFDMIVMMRAAEEEGVEDVFERVFAAYNRHGVHDTQVRQKLIDLAKRGIWGSYSLAMLEKRHGGRDRFADKKGPDIWRLRYHELEGVPIEEYPEKAYDYAVADVDGTAYVYERQLDPRTSEYGYLSGPQGVVNEAPQVRADLALNLTRSAGLRVDRDYTIKLRDEYQQQWDALTGYIQDIGIIRSDGTMDTSKVKALMTEAFDLAGITDPEITETEGGDVSTSKKAFQAVVESGILDSSDRLSDLAIIVERRKVDKYLTTYMDPMVDCHPYGIFPGFDVLKETGRTSSKGPNIQNFPKHDKWPLFEGPIYALYDAYGAPHHIDSTRVRKCFIPRDGNVYVDIDYSTLELRTLAQVCINLGFDSELARALNSGRDVHLQFGCALLGITYEEGLRRRRLPKSDPLKAGIEKHRFLAKAFNFGLPGGMGARKFQAHCRESFGVKFTLDEINKYKRLWFQTWPEIKQYFDYIGTLEFQKNKYFVRQHGPNGANQTWRVRSLKGFPTACNTLFQGLAADGCKTAYWELAKACYVDKSSPLYGFRINAFVHDEFLFEGPEDRASEAADEATRIMIESMQIHTPDIKIEAEPALSRRWDVKAESQKVDGIWSIYESQQEAA